MRIVVVDDDGICDGGGRDCNNTLSFYNKMVDE